MHVSEKAPESHRLIDTAAHCSVAQWQHANVLLIHTKCADVLRDGWLFSITFLLESTAECFLDLHRFDWMAWFWADAGHEQRYGCSVREEIKSQSFGGRLIFNFFVCFYWELYNIKAIKKANILFYCHAE